MRSARAARPGLTQALEMLREGGTVIIRKPDGLGRSVKQRADLVSELHKQDFQFESLTDVIDTPSGRIFSQVMAASRKWSAS